MSFERHIFISYAHMDNQPLPPEQQGWISRFHDSLNSMLSMRLGREARIWRDDKLQGNDDFAGEIADQFDTTAILVSVLTPRYLNSEWCTREVREFCEQAEHQGGVMVGHKSRVFKVLKTPIDSERSLPPIISDVLGYEFFTFENGAPLELDPAYGPTFAQNYNRKIGKLAWEAAQLLGTLEKGGLGDAKSVAPDPAGAAVYLAECSSDRRDARERLEAALQHHGYTVLPDQKLPLDDEADYVEKARQAMARCRLSIHLIGNSYGVVPDGPSHKSTVVLQNELAAQESKSGALKRVIWLPDARSDRPRQQAFIDALHQDPEAQYGADLLTGSLEELKGAIHETLAVIQKGERSSPEVKAAGAAECRRVYLICVKQDRRASLPLRRYLKDAGLEVSIPAFDGGDGGASAVREANHQLLCSCDAVLVFYGAGDEAWKRTIDNELMKMAAYRGGRPLLANYTYLAEPQTEDKQDLIELGEAGVITGLAGFEAAALEDFCQALGAGRDEA